MSSPTLHRCQCCGSRIPKEGVFEAHDAKSLPKKDRIRERLSPGSIEFPYKYHTVLRSRGAGGGRMGYRSWVERCGPVVPETFDEYIEQLESFLGTEIL